MSQHRPMLENRIWIVPARAADGSVSITFTMNQPTPAAANHGVVRARGMVLDDLVLTIPKATPEQIATAVAAYLAAHPPAPGRAPTSAEIAAAVATYQVANPVATLTKVEFAASLVDAYAVGLSAGGAEKRIACAGVKATDTLTVQPTAALPAGYMIGAVSCSENGWVRVGFVRPLLALGANNTIPLKVSAIR